MFFQSSTLLSNPCLLVFSTVVIARDHDEGYWSAEASFLPPLVCTPRVTRQALSPLHPFPGQSRSVGSRRRVFHIKREDEGLHYDRNRIQRKSTRMVAQIKDTDEELATSS